MLDPMLTSAYIVCRECLSSRGFTSLPHIVSLVDDYLNTFSFRWSVPAACEAGLSRRALEYLSARDPRWKFSERSARLAMQRGFVHVLEWLGDYYPDRIAYVRDRGAYLTHMVAMQGHLPVLQWFHANDIKFSTAAMEAAAVSGHLHIVQWLHENRVDQYTKSAMNRAARFGHLEVAKWLHDNSFEGWSTEVMDNAAANGHLEVVKFLHENRHEGCTERAMRFAAMSGHLEVVQWLYANRSEGRVWVAMRYAAKMDRLEVVEWLYPIVLKQRRGDVCIQEVLKIALRAGRVKVAEFLQRKLKRQRLS